jgi:ferric-dicitrate binding protein FerR (iron transport regulator)
MTENQLVSLIARHISGELTEKEVGELRRWADADPNNQLLLERVSNEEELEKELDRWRSIDANEGHARVVSILQTHRRVRIRRIVGWSVAASLITAFGVIGLSRKTARPTLPAPIVAKASQTVLPGRNTAILRLSNGQEIQLDSAGNGNLAIQGNARLVKLDSGSLSYVLAGTDKNEIVPYNTLTTPRSGQYQLRLPDGSRVWLNNVSSLRYPTSFQGKTREVELSGEAYFEIAKDAAKPFVVKLRGEDVEVLGTSFNIMAYPEETTQTTLLTGGVRVKTGKTSVVLDPDEQAQLNESGSLKVLKNVPSQDIVSWKDGFFYFGRASFAAVMNKLARWYDVKVIYEGKAPDMEFGGKIDRSLPLNELLKFLDQNQVHFRLEGHTLVVLPS